jgi:Flp pilus assembly pilin Flp
MLNKIKAFLKNETGAETLEYIVIAGVIITLGAAAYGAAGISGLITNIFGTLSGLVTAA